VEDGEARGRTAAAAEPLARPFPCWGEHYLAARRPPNRPPVFRRAPGQRRMLRGWG
jgi:hypothetical protein